MGLLDTTDEDKSNAMNMGLLTAGLNILANNTSRNPMRAIGQGGISGLAAYEVALNQAQKQRMNQLQINEYQKHLQQQETKQAALMQLRERVPDEHKPMFDADPMGYIAKATKKEAPIKLGQGETLFDPSTFQPIATGLPKEDAVPSSIKEYQFAVQQGFKGSFTDFEVAKRKAGASTTQIITPKDMIGYERDMRKDFEGLEAVKTYRSAYPAYAAIVDSAPRDTPQSEINLVYGLAKLYDPTSVVREGEYNTIAKSQAIPEWLKGIANNLAGGGKLTAETKSQILKEAEGRIGALEGEYTKSLSAYRDIAGRNNLDPRNIFQDVGRVGADGRIKDSAKPNAKSKQISLDDGSKVLATLGSDGNYYVMKGGKKYRVEE